MNESSMTGRWCTGWWIRSAMTDRCPSW